ncbi:MAG TPA: hypothetical protein VFM18_18250 [Methanosarcina sp.]|nr:hypothetical protein [Methanosarcina sp.]
METLYYPYAVVVPARSEIKEWADKNCTRFAIDDLIMFSKYTNERLEKYHFVNEEDATLFRLRWE